MTIEAFEQELAYHLKKQRLLHPGMEQADVVKFVFQAMLGAGHLLSDRATVADRIAREMEGLSSDADEPLLELLSPDWCRLNLRRAMAEAIPPRVIAGLMCASPSDGRFSRRDVFDVCSRLVSAGQRDVLDPRMLSAILDEAWLPSHSEVYRRRHRPAYRVISTSWIPRMEAVLKIASTQAHTRRLLITLDGPCASGKTTLADALAQVFGVNQVHTDDFVVPHAQKTAARLAIPGGNCDVERLVREIVVPWKWGRTVTYRRYDCRQDRLLPEETLPQADGLILEGSYSSLPAIRDCADVRLFMDTPEAIRMERLQRREPPESLRRFYEKWIPLENAYFEAFGLPDSGCLRIR